MSAGYESNGHYLTLSSFPSSGFYPYINHLFSWCAKIDENLIFEQICSNSVKTNSQPYLLLFASNILAFKIQASDLRPL